MADLNLTASRRNFIKAAGAALAVGAGAALVGCSPSDNSEEGSSANDSVESVDDIEWDGEYDVIVVGGGIAGLATAATVASEGDGKSCLLLEKADSYGGNSFYSSGYCMYTNDPDEFFETYITGLQGETDCTPDDVLQAYCNGITENVSWLEGLGAGDYMLVMDPGYEGAQTNQNPEYPEIDGAQYMGALLFNGGDDGSGPTHIAQFLLEYVQGQESVDYKTSTPMTALVQDPDTGAILGVVAGEDSNSYYHANGGVVMCTGGFENDSEYMETYMGVTGATPAAAQMNTADGHRACAKAGADMWHMHSGACFWMAPRNLENTSFTQTQPTGLTKEYGITVGVNGRRFYMDWDACAAGDVLEIGSDLRTNVGFRHGATQWGGRWVHLPMPSQAWFIYDADGLAAGALPEDLTSDPVADGWAYSADTLEELAEQIDVPSDELEHTVEVWNGYCDDGEDPAFYRPAEHMTKVATAPYYATLCTPTLLNTDGGPVRDAEARILDPYGEPIPNLYSAGEFGSIWGAMYQGTGNIAECCCFGRIAARNAIAAVDEE